MGEKWQNMPFLGKTCVLVPVPKVGTGNRYQKKVVPVPKDSGTGTHSQKGLVLVPMLPATLIFVPLHC